MTHALPQQTIGKSQVHLTPRHLLDRLGRFDLDPCAAEPRPWDCARVNYVKTDDGLSLPWFGSVWLNPPFDRRVIGKWIARLVEHGDGMALVHARVETAWFEQIWAGADRILFLGDRVRFYLPDGSVQSNDSGAPVAIAAFGADCADRLRRAGIPGAFVERWSVAA